MNYTIPDINTVMGSVPEQELEHNQEQLVERGKLLTHLLDNFGVQASVINICPGPVITRYELKLAPGVKAVSVEKLATDLAMGLKAKSIRVLPVTEKSIVGVEIPNEKPQMVYLRELFNAPEFVNTDGINIVLGRDVTGNPVYTDLTRAPHLLVAGQTGSGKSVGINTFLMSMLATKTPEELRLILIDPKIVELSPYNPIPHLLNPVITEATTAIKVLDWVAKRMDYRYEVLAEAGTRNIQNYNRKPDVCKMPYIVIVIDEMADLMMTAGKKAEHQIVRIAQKARAVGIHLILTTQRPSVNVITGLIKANVPSRVGLQTTSQIDSRIILDKNGCENLLGRGDMLFQDVAAPDLRRIHGAFVDYPDIDAMVKTCAKQGTTDHIKFDDDIKITIHGSNVINSKLVDSAKKLIQNGGTPQVAFLQRKLNISYEVANKIMKQLEKQGFVE